MTTDQFPSSADEAFQVFVSDIKDFRKSIDALIQRSELYLDAPFKMKATREMSLVRTKLQEAKMWAGKILEVAGNPFPADLADKAPPLASSLGGTAALNK